MGIDIRNRLCYLPIALSAGAMLLPGCDTANNQTQSSHRPTRPAIEPAIAEETASFYTVSHYGEERDVEADLKMTLARAASENKRVLLQVGGDWCGWCKRLSGFIEKTDNVRTLLEKNYLLMKVTYTQKQPNEVFLAKYPKIKGYPHIFVLDAEGKLLHSQDTGELEDGKDDYVEEKVIEFLEGWKR